MSEHLLTDEDVIAERDATIQQQAAQIAVLRDALGRIARNEFGCSSDGDMAWAALADPNPEAERLVKLAHLLGNQEQAIAVMTDGLAVSSGLAAAMLNRLLAAINDAVSKEGE